MIESYNVFNFDTEKLKCFGFALEWFLLEILDVFVLIKLVRK